MIVIEARLPEAEGASVLKAIEAAMAVLEARKEKKAAQGVNEAELEEDCAKGASAEAGVDKVGAAGASAEAGVDKAGSASASAEAGEGKDCAKSVSAEAEALPKPEMHLSLSQRRADALVFLSEAALANGLKRKQRNAPYQVVMHVDAEVLADPKTQGRCCIENSGAISVASAKRLMCDASVLKISHTHDGSVLDVGRRTRKISSRLFTALLCRDEQCVFPGCGRTDNLKAHHIRHWSDGGPTDIANITLLCDMHHFLVHEGGFEVKGTAPDGLSFYDPEGHPIQTVLLPPVVKGDPLENLRVQNEDDGLIIDENTNCIGWRGERLDLDFAVSGLLYHLWH